MSTHRRIQKSYGFSDDLIMGIINEKMDGASYPYLVQKHGIAHGTMVNWCKGLTKPHLYDKVTDQRYKQRKPIE